MNNYLIWKYSFPDSTNFSLEVPSDFRIMHILAQGGWGHIYMMVDPDSPRKRIGVTLIPTGQKFDPAKVGCYAGTFAVESTGVVAHVFIDHSEKVDLH